MKQPMNRSLVVINASFTLGWLVQNDARCYQRGMGKRMRGLRTCSEMSFFLRKMWICKKWIWMHTAHQKNRLLEYWMQIENNFIDIQNKNSLQKTLCRSGMVDNLSSSWKGERTSVWWFGVFGGPQSDTMFWGEIGFLGLGPNVEQWHVFVFFSGVKAGT